MTAQEARQSSEDSAKEEIEMIIEKIKSAAKGKFNCVRVGNWFKSPSLAAIHYFESRGYSYSVRSSKIFW